MVYFVNIFQEKLSYSRFFRIVRSNQFLMCSVISFSFHEFNGLRAYWIGSSLEREGQSVYQYVRLSSFYFTSCIPAVTLAFLFSLFGRYELLDQEFLWNAVKVDLE